MMRGCAGGPPFRPVLAKGGQLIYSANASNATTATVAVNIRHTNAGAIQSDMSCFRFIVVSP